MPDVNETNDLGPVYGVRLIKELPLGKGAMTQAMPSRHDLNCAKQVSQRTVAGYEVLLDHYRKQCDEVGRLTSIIRRVLQGQWSPTDLQEAIGDI